MNLALALNASKKKFKLRPTTVFKYVTYFAIAVALLSLLVIIGFVIIKGAPNLSWHFIFGKHSSSNMSISGVLVTTLKLILVSILIATPIGICCAIFLVEYTNRGNKLVKVIKVATETLAGVPSIVFGLFGMLLFVEGLRMGRGVWAASFTLSLMILPTIITSVEESIRAVPDSLREGSFGLGASKLRTVFKVVLPNAIAGILTSIILSMGRIVSESACVLFTAGTSFNMPRSFGGQGASLAVAMYLCASEGKFSEAYAIGVVLIILVVALNIFATLIAKKLDKKNMK